MSLPIAATTSQTRPAQRSSKPSARLSSRDPDRLLDEIRRLLAEDFTAAARLAVEAAERFPEHGGLSKARRVLGGGEARVGSGGPRLSRHADFEWLRDPPAEFRGRWVALVGGRLVGSADSLDELAVALEPQSFERAPLVHCVE
jgi:hypothetical protein